MSITSDEKIKVLVVDDEQAQRLIISRVLREAGYETDEAENVHTALAKLEAGRFQLVLTDQRMPDGEGLDILRQVQRTGHGPEVILMTAYGSIPNAVAAIKLGALDYLCKPFEKDELLLVIQRAVERILLRSENKRLRELMSQTSTHGFSGIIGTSPIMQEVYRIMKLAIPVDSTVLIEGESGTGKELVARSIHYLGPRRSGPFLVVNCAAIPQQLLESELFGHVKGAFTGAVADKQGKFALADEGTIFLDEIGDMPPEAQAKLLRVLQERTIEPVGSNKLIPVNIRVIAATNKDLTSEVESGNFREDLYYRLKVIPIVLPPLRNRREDIPLLIDHFKTTLSERFGKPFPELQPQVVDVLMRYSWSGNVRELHNVLERLLILTERSEITIGDLPENMRQLAESPGEQECYAGMRLPEDGISFESMEKELLAQALRRAQGNVAEAARLVGLSYKTMQYRIKKFNLIDEIKEE